MDSFNRLRTNSARYFAELSELVVAVSADVREVEETLLQNLKVITQQSNKIRELESELSRLNGQNEALRNSLQNAVSFSEQEQEQKSALVAELAETKKKLTEAEKDLEEVHPARLRRKAELRKAQAAKLLEEARQLEREAG